MRSRPPFGASDVSPSEHVSLTCRGLGTQTPRRMLASASRKVSGRYVILPIDGESAAPDMATAAGRVMSRRRLRPRFSYLSVSAAPVSGPPIAVGLKVKLATARPGGVAPGSDTFAAAQTMSIGHLSNSGPGSTRDLDSSTIASNGRWRATPRLPLRCAGGGAGRSLPSASSGQMRRSANAVARRRR